MLGTPPPDRGALMVSSPSSKIGVVGSGGVGCGVVGAVVVVLSVGSG